MSGGKGDDFLIGGEGADTLIGGNGEGAIDTASFAGSADIYTIASTSKWIGVKTDGTYEKDANGDIKIFTSASGVAGGSTAVKGFSVTTKDIDGDGSVSSSEKSGSATVSDLVFEVENFEFSDGMFRSSMEMFVEDLTLTLLLILQIYWVHWLTILFPRLILLT